LSFAEPLLPPADGEVPVVAGRPGGRPWVDTVRSAADRAGADGTIVTAAAGSHRGLVVAGWGAAAESPLVDTLAASGWPVLADPLSGLRTTAGPVVVARYEALVRVAAWADAHRPDVVVRLGAPLTSKVTGQWLDGLGVPTVLVDPEGAWADPGRAAWEHVTRLPALAPADPAWAGAWCRAEAAVGAAIDALLDGWVEPFEGRVARDVAAVLPDGAVLVAASSMPVRDVEWFVRPRSGVRFLANRGVNGIDGLVSTTLGIAAGGAGPVVALLGDLAVVHDSGGLVGAAARGVDAVLVVLDNGGGGIFSFLPQAGLATDLFERYWGTPSGVDLAALAAAHGIPVRTVERAGDVGPAVADALAAGGVRLVRVPTDRADNVARHRAVWEAAAAALAESGDPAAP
jgi:2-succinyl-5-enolpyruvyl-6-hydroxy-3-cyclohexene-1-carboxylate synthase